jgi:SulP family sulfate permease
MAGIIHSLVLLMIFLFLMPYAIYIPLSCLAAILVMVAYNMSEWRTFRYLLKGDRADVIVLLITFFLTVLIDLTVAIEVGLLMAIILFVKRVSETSSITVIESDYLAATENEEKAQLDSTEQLSVPAGVEIFEIDGPFFFGLASKIDELDRTTKKDIVKVRIIRMRKVPFIDSTGVNNLRSLYKRSKRSGIQLILSGVQDNVYASLDKFGLLHEIGKEYVFPHIIPALAKATEMVMVSEKKGSLPKNRIS